MKTVAATPDAVHQSFITLLDQHRRMVFKVANTYARVGAEREDLAQEIAAQLRRAFPAYDASRPFSTWLYRIALNTGISHLRRSSLRARRTVPFELEQHEIADPHAASPDGEDPAVVLETFMAQLDALDRALLLLYLEENSYRDIADILGISETNVSTKINRLKERVRRFGETHGTR
jgi:RNA polymerase sigma factor (sigma-70 family)